MVMYEGRYVTPQHVELLERQKEAKVSQADWANTSRAAAALAHRPAAGPRRPGARRNSGDPRSAGRRSRRRPCCGAKNDPRSDAAVDRGRVAARPSGGGRRAGGSVADRSGPEIRHQCLEYLIKSGRPGWSTPYIRALKNRDNEIVNRAGAALGQIGDADAIGPLIDALITKHKFKISDANPDQHAYTFSPRWRRVQLRRQRPAGRHRRRCATRPCSAALVTLSGGTSFDYDQEQWRRWLAAQAKLNAVDVRRDE